MSFEQPFSEPTIFKKRKGNADDPFLEIEELVSVIGGKALLTEVPYKFNRVQIVEQVTSGDGNVTETIDGGNFTDFSAINETVPIGSFYETDFSPASANQYNVDYTEGLMNFHPSQEGSKFVVKYKGTGFHSISSHRVYTQTNGNQVTQTLEDITSTLPNLDEKITEANQATLNANNATADFQTLLDEQLLIYKSAVNTYSDLATAYPTPELGWVATALDTGIRWRYDGVEWMNIGYDDVSGFRVLVSSTPPININSLWVNVPVGSVTKNAKVVQSDVEPSDTSVIWWKTN